MPDDADKQPPEPQGSFVPPTVEALQAMLPQYEIIAIIGIGGMGAVYKARQPNLDRRVAIKVLPSDAGAEYGFAERFQREAQAMAKLHHQRIVTVHDFGEAELPPGHASAGSAKLLYIVMEFVEGTDLYGLIQNGSLDQNQTLAIITQVCDALHYAHEHGIVHRDIKPANIMLDVEGNVKVADFGLAKLVNSKVQTQLTMTNMAMGTPDYVAPEQLEAGVEVDHRADIYSLGVMIYEMLTGTVPRGAFLPPSQKATDPLDPRLDEVVTLAMQADPNTRYQQVTQLWTDVDRIRTMPAPRGATARVPVMAGATGKVQLVTGDTGKISAKAQPQTPLPTKPDNTKTVVLVSIAVAAALFAVLVLIYLISQPAPSDSGEPIATSTPTSGKEARDRERGPSELRPRPKPSSPKKEIRNQTGQRTTAKPVKPKPEPKPEPTAAPEPAPAPTPPASPQPERTQGTIDLLAAVDTDRNTISGEWERVDGDLQRAADDPDSEALLHIPHLHSGPFILRASFTPVDTSAATAIIFPVGVKPVELVLGGYPDHEQGPVSGLAAIDGHPAPDNPTAVFNHSLDVGRAHSLELRVAEFPATIEVDLDGEPLIRWTGNKGKLSLMGTNRDEINHSKFYLVHLGKASVRYHSITLIPGDPESSSSSSSEALAEPTPAPPPNPETEAGKKLIELSEIFRQRFSEGDGPGAVFTGAVASLNTSYAGALQRESEKIAGEGDLDPVLAFKTEMDAVNVMEGAALSSPLPENAPDTLAAMRQTYTETIAKHAAKRDTDALPLLRAFDQALETLIINFTRAQQIEDALEVRDFRDRLKEKGASLLIRYN